MSTLRDEDIQGRSEFESRAEVPGDADDQDDTDADDADADTSDADTDTSDADTDTTDPS
jgi:hypothetical protein